MRFIISSIILVIMVFLSPSTYASQRILTAQQIERVRLVKEELRDVDTKSVLDTIHELEKTRHPEINLLMKEAMAKTYTDIISEFKLEGQKKKEWLYSMVCLNMAYLQFGGSQGSPGSTSELNRLILHKLKGYLPADIFKRPGFIYSLD